MAEVPKNPRSFRLSDGDYQHLYELQRRLGGKSGAEVVSAALTHLLATVQRDERVHVTVPSDEQDDAGPGK